MIRARLPEGIVALHALEPDQDVLHGIVQGVAHVELPCDVRRGNHDGEGFPVVVHLRAEILPVQPFLIQPVLQPSGVVGLCQFRGMPFFHGMLFFRGMPFFHAHKLLLSALRRRPGSRECPSSIPSKGPIPESKKALCRLSSAKGVINAVPPLFTAGRTRVHTASSDFY